MTHKTEIRIEISAVDAELVAALRDDLANLLSIRTTKLIDIHRGANVLFTTRTCAVMPEGAGAPLAGLDAPLQVGEVGKDAPKHEQGCDCSACCPN